MQKLRIAFLSGLFLAGCTNDQVAVFESEGVITGIDGRFCLCYCGGYLITIDNEVYRFEADQLPAHGLDLSPENLPLSVALNWQSLAPTADCDATDKIRITAIREN